MNIREEIARALYCNVAQDTDRPDWEELPPPRREGWLDDADKILPIVREAAAKVATDHVIDPALGGDAGLTHWGEGHNAACKQIASELSRHFASLPKWQCPIDLDGCRENCGAYGCGN